VLGVDSNLATAIRTVVVVVFAWAVALFTNRESMATISGRTWLFLALSGLATGLSWLCYFRALQLGEASRVAPIDKLSGAMPHNPARVLIDRVEFASDLHVPL
jgi:transporter family protein